MAEEKAKGSCSEESLERCRATVRALVAAVPDVQEQDGPTGVLEFVEAVEREFQALSLLLSS